MFTFAADSREILKETGIRIKTKELQDFFFSLSQGKINSKLGDSEKERAEREMTKEKAHKKRPTHDCSPAAFCFPPPSMKRAAWEIVGRLLGDCERRKNEKKLAPLFLLRALLS